MNALFWRIAAALTVLRSRHYAVAYLRKDRRGRIHSGRCVASHVDWGDELRDATLGAYNAIAREQPPTSPGPRVQVPHIRREDPAQAGMLVNGVPTHTS